MNILEETQKLVARLDLRPNSLDFNPWKVQRENFTSTIGYFQACSDNERALFDKYDGRIASGFYGFDTRGFPQKWYDAVFSFLELLEKDSPDFEIYQIKLKWSFARMYLGNISEPAQKSIDLLESVLYDENLIY